ncbi:MAG: alpha/beta fold hydrolase [Myxococcota bacterium]
MSSQTDRARDTPYVEHVLTLPGRGEIFFRECRENAGAPTLFLLHGLGATGLLNWRSALDALARRYRVLVVDHRGHGRGIATRAPFRLADCADDVAALADALEIPSFFAAGYSMGGPIAQLLWHRHPTRVEGLVLCATAARFSSPEARRLAFLASPSLRVFGRLAPRDTIRRRALEYVSDQLDDPGIRDRVLEEVAQSDPVAIGQAAAAVLRFDSHGWIHEVDVPTAVVLTERDGMVHPSAQRALADRLRDTRIYPVDADHAACRTAPKAFVPALTEACASVVERADAGRRAPRFAAD